METILFPAYSSKSQFLTAMEERPYIQYQGQKGQGYKHREKFLSLSLSLSFS